MGHASPPERCPGHSAGTARRENPSCPGSHTRASAPSDHQQRPSDRADGRVRTRPRDRHTSACRHARLMRVLHACGRTALQWSRCGAAVVSCRSRAVHPTSVFTRRAPPAPASFPNNGFRDPSKAIPSTIESRTPVRKAVFHMRAPLSRPARHPDTPEPHTTPSPVSRASV